jgi:hypothetical protein
MTDEDALAEFSRGMHDIYRRAKVEAGYNATIYLRMLSELGPLETARRLINASTPSDGFVHLWERKRLDLTVAALVLRQSFEGLFSEDDREICRRRLAEYGFSDVDRERRERLSEET